MSLESFKENKLLKQPEDILRIFLAFVFLTAGVFRIFNYNMAVSEFFVLGMPIFLCPLMIIFEIGAGIGLLFNKFVKYIYSALIVFILFALVVALVVNGKEIISRAGELFVFNLTPTDWLLHFVFLLIAAILFIKKK